MNELKKACRASVLAVLATLMVSQPAIAVDTVEYIHTDALGSPVAVTDAYGNVRERTVYEPYGAATNRVVGDGPGYVDHVTDASTGLSYMQQRYYDPDSATFLSVDPISASESIFSRYGYARGNPYGFTDPDGRSPVELDKKVREATTGSRIKGGGVAAGSRMGTLGAGGGSTQGTRYGRKPEPSDPEWTRDPKLLSQTEKAWEDSKPYAAPVQRGLAGSTKRENGGWIVKYPGQSGYDLARSPPGSRDRMSVESTIKPSEFECGCIVKGFYHSHPNTVGEGYVPGANVFDYIYQIQQGVPGLIRSHDGYEYIPIPGAK